MSYQLNNDLGFVYDLSSYGLSEPGSMDDSGLSNSLDDIASSNPDSWSLYEENFVTSDSAAGPSGQPSFTQRPLQHWEPENCLEWGLHICQKYDIDKLYIDIGTLGQTNGPQLMKFTQSDFCKLLGDQYGHTFYKELQNMKKNRSTEVGGSYLDNSNGIGQSLYSVNTDSYISSMDSYSTNYNSAEMSLSKYNVPLDQCVRTMDSFSTTFSSPYANNNIDIKQNPSYTLNSNQCITNLESYSTNYKSPYSENNSRMDQSSYTVKTEECITNIDSYSASYKSPYSENNSRMDQSSYTVKTEECITSIDSYSASYKSPYSDNNLRISQSPYTVKLEECAPSMDSYSKIYKSPYSKNSSICEGSQYSTNLNPYHSNMDSYSSTSSCPQDLLDSGKSEFELTGNLEDFDSESDVTIDYDDTTWDLPEETWKQIDITDPNLDLNFDELILENVDTIDSVAKVKRKCGKGQAKKNIKKSTLRMNISADCVEDIVRKTNGAAKRERCPRSWEFLMRLLVNSETNPSVIRWEDESQHIFRLVNADSVVQIWNTKSQKASINKDNFARSLRYHYKKGILIPVPEKQLVYQCGPKAIEYLNKLRKTLS